MEEKLPPYRQYNTQTNRYNLSQEVPRVKNCNGFLATNIGDTPVTVNKKILFPSTTPLTVQGDAISFGGNEGEIYVGTIDIAFLVPLGATPLIEIIQKYYIDKE